MEMLDEEHDPPAQPGAEDNVYKLGSINRHNVVVIGLPRPGNCSAATVVAQMKLTFPNLRYDVLVGIGGGVPLSRESGIIRLGHVVVSKPTGRHSGVLQYDPGKTREGLFEQTRALVSPPAALLNAAQALEVERARLNDDSVQRNVQRIQTTRQGLQLFRCPGAENDLLFQREYIHQRPGHTCEESRCDPQQQIKPLTSFGSDNN